MIGALARNAATLALTSLVAFATLCAMPGDPVEIALMAWSVNPTPEAAAALRREWGLDQGVVSQYVAWLARFASGDWGVSFRTGRPILREMLDRLPISAALGFGSIALAALLAVPLGFLAARRPGGIADRVSRAINVLSQSMPAFCVGLMLIWLLGVKLQLLRPFSGEPWTRVGLPILLLAFYSLGTLARVYRTGLLAVTREPYFTTARAKGLGRTQALWAHGNAAALYAMVAALVPEFAWAIGGTAVCEIVFGLPGISLFLVQSIGARDYFVLQAYVVVIAAWMLLVRAAAQALLRRLEPRL